MNQTRSIKCPRCQAASKWAGNPDRPFCSEKCRLIDLGRWADEEYRIPTSERPMSEENVLPFSGDNEE